MQKLDKQDFSKLNTKNLKDNTQLGFVPECRIGFNSQNAINVIHINKGKTKTRITISTGAEQAFGKSNFHS